MNSAIEAQVLRRGLVPNIRTNAVTPEWLEAQKAKWMAKREHGAFEEFDTFDTATPEQIKTLGKVDTAAWIYHYRSVNVSEKTKAERAKQSNEGGVWGPRLSPFEMDHVQQTLREYLHKTRTSARSFARVCQKDQKWVRGITNGQYAYMYEMTRNCILKAIRKAPYGYGPSGFPKECNA